MCAWSLCSVCTGWLLGTKKHGGQQQTSSKRDYCLKRFAANQTPSLEYFKGHVTQKTSSMDTV